MAILKRGQPCITQLYPPTSFVIIPMHNIVLVYTYYCTIQLVVKYTTLCLCVAVTLVGVNILVLSLINHHSYGAFTARYTQAHKAHNVEGKAGAMAD